jgi:hypothetical protein
MSERIAQMRESIKSTGEKPPAELLKRKQEFEKWARTVGWRK